MFDIDDMSIILFLLLSLVYSGMVKVEVVLAADLHNERLDENINAKRERSDTMPQKRLIAFGDSLTRGYQVDLKISLFPFETPYINYLKSRMGDGWILESKGINGELTDQMLLRFKRDVLDKKPDIVVILGGANDIGWEVNTDIIIKNLTSMAQQAIDAGITPILCTVPSLRGFDSLIALRRMVNSALIAFAKEHSISIVDLFTVTIDEQMRLAEKYSSDGLHLNTEGYKLMADAIYKHALQSY